jgi:hypothetical protein
MDRSDDWYRQVLDLKVKLDSLEEAKEEARRLGSDRTWRRLNRQQGEIARKLDDLQK